MLYEKTFPMTTAEMNSADDLQDMEANMAKMGDSNVGI